LKNKAKKIFPTRKLEKNDRVAYCLVSAVLLTFPIAVLMIIKTPLGHFFGCVFLRVTGKPCMFCGVTRSFESCLELKFIQAFRWHLFGPFFFACYLVLLLKYLIGFISGYTIDVKIKEPKTRNMIFYISGGIIFVYWILRLLDVPFFTFPG